MGWYKLFLSDCNVPLSLSLSICLYFFIFNCILCSNLSRCCEGVRYLCFFVFAESYRGLTMKQSEAHISRVGQYCDSSCSRGLQTLTRNFVVLQKFVALFQVPRVLTDSLDAFSAEETPVRYGHNISCQDGANVLRPRRSSFPSIRPSRLST